MSAMADPTRMFMVNDHNGLLLSGEVASHQKIRLANRSTAMSIFSGVSYVPAAISALIRFTKSNLILGDSALVLAMLLKRRDSSEKEIESLCDNVGLAVSAALFSTGDRCDP